MRVNRRFSPAFVALALVVFAGSGLALANGGSNEDAAIHIKNFGCLNDAYYRGAQPKAEDFKRLAAMGVRTVIDLQREGERDEPRWVEAAGMKFYRIPMSDSAAPPIQQVEEFLKLVDDPANQPVFVHCRGGRHRTGAMTAVYRMTHQGWSAQQAYDEMKKFEFESGFGHDALKRFVFDYFDRMKQHDVAVQTDK